MTDSSGPAKTRRSPGALEHGFLLLPVDFEKEMKYFLPSALKTYLVLRFRTIFEDNVGITTAALARITNMSEDSVRKALKWLEEPTSRSKNPGDPARTLPVYIRRDQLKEHEYSERLVQTIYIEKWRDPRSVAEDITKSREEEKASRRARTRKDEGKKDEAE